ncbi:MAG: thioredoxin [Myxococcota bacterium]|nr:thioredoxin [Myxococcota bacterium]
MAGDVLNVDDAQFQKEVLSAQEPVLVDFTAAWCAPCKAIAPHLEELASRYKGKVKVTKVDVDASMQTAQAFGIRSMPTLLMFKGGKVVDQIIGAVPKAKLEAFFTKHA